MKAAGGSCDTFYRCNSLNEPIVVLTIVSHITLLVSLLQSVKEEISYLTDGKELNICMDMYICILYENITILHRICMYVQSVVYYAEQNFTDIFV
jgi:hypothetical protein